MKELPLGLYDALITLGLSQQLADPSLDVRSAKLSVEGAAELFAQHVGRLAAAVLSSVPGDAKERLAGQVALTNRFVEVLTGVAQEGANSDEGLAVEPLDAVLPQRLLQVLRKDALGLGTGLIERPVLPLRSSDLVVNGPGDLRIGREIQRELASADRVDVLVSFVKWTGFVELRDALQAFCDRHRASGSAPPIRLLTTTYMGATDHEALDALEQMGVDVRVSYDARRTRLHAKAWLFHRNSGYSTGVVGSSNLSHAALRDGCEWNVRLSNVDNPGILRKFDATFAQYWDEGAFEAYDRARFLEVVSARRNPERDALATAVRLHPYPHQVDVLDALEAERAAGHSRNLVIAATGTGKTVIAALDYKRLPGRPRLLFVAHRREILEQSRATYRAALSDGSFGELLTGRDKPLRGEHVFATVQSLKRRMDGVSPAHYQVVVVDEFHHAEAATYTALLDYVEPEILLGLTATPERTDGQSILHWFDGRVAAETRLWDALDQGLLVPFQYFGVHDGTDLSRLDFRGGRYNVADLERVYTADEHRAKQVLRALQERVRDVTEMRALGFCVSKKHARFMAAYFCANGLPSVAVTDETSAGDRRAAIADLRAGNVCALFAVDLFNEGVDIPAVDTVMFLRPTESATVFLQQLGRGLRLHEDKACLTVLDFVGRAHRDFRFDRRFSAMVGGATRSELRTAIEEGFPRLPSGCSIQLDRASQEVVLEGVRRALSTWRSLADELVEDWPLAEFLRRAELDLREVYRKDKSFTALRVLRGYAEAGPSSAIVRSLARSLHVDDVDRLAAWRALLARETPPAPAPGDALQRMLFAVLGQATRPVSELGEFLQELWADTAVLGELRELFAVLQDGLRRPTFRLPELPFNVHATYTRDEIAAGLGEERKGKLLRTQGGVYRCEKHRCDVLYVTLQKDAKDFTPTTLYNDYVMSQSLFHWESQGATRRESATGRRYRNPPEGWRILLFVRRAIKDDRGLTNPYLLLGPVVCESAEGERPMRIVWRLERPVPAGWFNAVKIAAA